MNTTFDMYLIHSSNVNTPSIVRINPGTTGLFIVEWSTVCGHDECKISPNN